MIFRWKEYLAVAIATLSLAGCSPVEKSAPSGSGSSDQTSTTPSTAGSPLFFYIMTKPEGASAGSYTTAGSCIIPYGTASGGATQACSISVHELTLYYSDLKFVAGTSDATTCAFISFSPFYYVKSNQAGFADSGTTSVVDCSPSFAARPSACFGGAAPLILGSAFPSSSGQYFVPGDSLTQSWAIDSLNKQRSTHLTDLSFVNSNANIANDLVNRTPAIAYSATTPVIFAGGSSNYHDYVVSCKDTYGADLYSITVTVSDDDGAVDDFYDWN